MATTLKTKNSVTTTVVPTTLAQGELAVNITDKKMWVGNAATTPVQILGAGATNRAGGSNTQVQYNSSGDLAGSANMTFSGTALTLANDASISGLTVGKGGGAVSTNTAIGANALATNTTGASNTAIGIGSLQLNTTGSSNFSGGQAALLANTTGSYNVAVGMESLRFNTTASNNTAVGYQAGYSNTTGTAITAVGYRAAYSNTTGNVDAFGFNAGSANTTGANNVAIGWDSLASNTTGGGNIAMGRGALYANTTASANIGIGVEALRLNTTGFANTALGYQAGYNNTSSQENTFIGRGAGYTSTGAYNTCVGAFAGYYLTTGTNNTFVGPSGASASGLNMTTGSKNTILGAYNGNQGGLDIRTASNYIVLSDGDGNPRMIGDSSGYFGVGVAPSARMTLKGVNGDGFGGGIKLVRFGSTNNWEQVAGGDDKLYFGFNSVAMASINSTTGAYTALSDKNLKKNIVDISYGLDAITALRPVEYNMLEESDEGIKHLGFIAQEAQEILPSSVSKIMNDVLGMDKSEVIPVLVKAIQELNAKVTALETQLQGK